MQVYVAKLYLICDSSDPDVLKEFDRRFTRAIEREWSEIVVEKKSPSSDDDLRTVLDQEITSKYTSGPEYWIQNDISAIPLVYVSLNPSFLKSVWSPGSGGRHEANRIPIMVTTTTSTVQWYFSASSGKGAYMFANVSWRLVDVR